MFIRLHKSKASKHPSVQVLESYRVGGKVKQKILHTLGAIRSDEDKDRLLYMAHALIAKLEKDPAHDPQFSFNLGFELEKTLKRKPTISNPDLVNPKDLMHVRDEVCGFEEITTALSKKIGFEEILKKIDTNGDHSFSTREIITMLISKRLQAPHSKRESLRQEVYEKGFLPYPLHQVYRAMDCLEPFCEEFQGAAYNAAVSLLGQKIECFFYDATTLYFESVINDSLKNFGWGKDGKFNQVQILFCLLVTTEGLPVGYEVFPGNTGETNTLERALENLKKRFTVAKATIVCDRGMLSGKNLDFAENTAKMYYIIGEKLRKLSAVHHELIFDKSTYAAIGENLIKDIPHPKRAGARLILIYSPDRAKKDKIDRERLLKKIQKKLEKKKAEPKDFISNTGVKKYVASKGGSASLNSEAIAKEEKWDGFFGIVTNHPTHTPGKILSHYRGLWQVEASFRVAKHNLSTRPIFHWSPHRVQTHILICFMALVVERQLEVILKMQNTPLTQDGIHQALTACRKIIFQDQTTNKVYEMQTNKPQQAKQIYSALGLGYRSITREIAQPKANVVCTQRSVRPQDLGIITV